MVLSYRLRLPGGPTGLKELPVVGLGLGDGAARLLAKGHDDDVVRKTLPKFDLPSPEPWMKEMAHADLNGVFLRAPMAVSFLIRRPELLPGNIPKELASAGLLEIRNGSPRMTRFAHGKRSPYGRDGVTHH